MHELAQPLVSFQNQTSNIILRTYIHSYIELREFQSFGLAKFGKFEVGFVQIRVEPEHVRVRFQVYLYILTGPEVRVWEVRSLDLSKVRRPSI